MRFTEKELANCPICKNKGCVPSSKEDSKTGFEDCICKNYKELKELLGPKLWGVPPLEGPSPLHRYYGKDCFARAVGSDMRKNDAETKLYQHIRRILQDELHQFNLSHARGEPYRYPQWCSLPGQILLDLQFSKEEGVREEERYIRQAPWIVLEIGESDLRNTYMRECLLTFESLRRQAGKSTWVFSKRDYAWLKDRYGVEVESWLKGLPVVKVG